MAEDVRSIVYVRACCFHVCMRACLCRYISTKACLFESIFKCHWPAPLSLSLAALKARQQSQRTANARMVARLFLIFSIMRMCSVQCVVWMIPEHCESRHDSSESLQTSSNGFQNSFHGFQACFNDFQNFFNGFQDCFNIFQESLQMPTQFHKQWISQQSRPVD